MVHAHTSRRSVRTIRTLLLGGTSFGVMSLLAPMSAAEAQLANLGGALGHNVNIGSIAPGSSGSAPAVATRTMTQISQRHAEYKLRVTQQQNLVADANKAARAAAQAASFDVAKSALYALTSKTQAKDANGVALVDAQGRPVYINSQLKDASGNALFYSGGSNQLYIVRREGSGEGASFVATGETINGMAPGGLVPVRQDMQNQSAATVWVGAAQPVETAPAAGSSGFTVEVKVDQTQARALLSWESFNIGRDTQLTFDQHKNNDWVVVNRVVGVDPLTGIDPDPTQILGRIKADGAVYILNRSNVLFGAQSQVDLHSLVASTLELGGTLETFKKDGNATQTFYRNKSLDDINNSYLQNGILPSDHAALLGSVIGVTHGSVNVAAGAQIRSTGGFVILAAPTVTMDGEVNPATDPAGAAVAQVTGSQVSLVAGDFVDVTPSTGADSSVDPYVRGLIVQALSAKVDEAGFHEADLAPRIAVGGSIAAPQGYISLVTTPKGKLSVGGYLSATTSVARNGKISLIGGDIDLLSGATLAITPDVSDATIPQASGSLAAFKHSQIDIGNYATEATLLGFGQIETIQLTEERTLGLLTPTLLPTNVRFNDGSTIYAPSADVNVGGLAGGARYLAGDYSLYLGKTDVHVGAGAVIDVSGLDAVDVDSSRNQIVIAPAKKNELRDTPIYRDVKTDGNFTLNGQTLYLDARLTGVRADGVAWVGSPLVEAGSIADQIGVTARQLMTTGGNVTLATLEMDDRAVLANIVPSAVTLDPGARIDFSGGWVNYLPGVIRSSQLITADGRIVDIAAADPNDVFVAVANGFTESLPQLDTPLGYANPLATATRFDNGYSEGRDAGSLNIVAPTASFNAELFGEAAAGTRQIIDAQAASAASGRAGDPRKLQAAFGQLPTAGLLSYSANVGASVLIGEAPADAPAELVQIRDTTIANAGLSALTINTSGAIVQTAGSEIGLAPGGAFSARAGRAIALNGTIAVPAGTIALETYANLHGDLFDANDELTTDYLAPTTTPGWFDLFSKVASAGAAAPSGWFDVTVNPGALLSTRGLWSNDLLVEDGLYRGGAYTSGGNISIGVAPHVVGLTKLVTATGTSETRAVDLSGSIEIAAGSRLDLSGGGFISRTGEMSLDGKGGSLTLTNQTTFFQLAQTDSSYTGTEQGDALLAVDLTGFQLATGSGYTSALTPDRIVSHVAIAADTIRAFGFQGGGTFKLTTPDLNFGGNGDSGTLIPLDFLDKTGFGTLDLAAWNTSFINNVFDNGRTGTTALLSTELVKIGSGQTLNLTQSVLPSILTTAQIRTLRAAGNDVILTDLEGFQPSNQFGDFYNRAANLVLGGLTELDIEGGSIVGAAGATITAPKLYQGGTIDIRGGKIVQSEFLPSSYFDRGAIAVGQMVDGRPVDQIAALSAVFGAADPETGLYSETATNAYFSNSDDPELRALTNQQLISRRNGVNATKGDRALYYLGRLAQDVGILFAAGSTTDLSGAVLLDPLAGSVNGVGIRTGRLVDGGTIYAAGRFTGNGALFSPTLVGDGSFGYRLRNISSYVPVAAREARALEAGAGAAIDISGAAGTFDINLNGIVRTGVVASFTETPVWSNGGLLSAQGGGNLTAVTIAAGGGDSAGRAAGGTIDWYNPVLRQNAAASLPDGVTAGRNLLDADWITAGKFGRFVARGLLATLGDVSLTLDQSFAMASPEQLGTSAVPSGYYASVINGTGDLSIVAPHVVLSSINQSASGLSDWIQALYGEHALSITARAAPGAIGGASFDIIGAIAIDAGFGSSTLSSQGDIRLIGVQAIETTLDPTFVSPTPSLTGGLVTAGALTMAAREIYVTTGTGNLLSSGSASLPFQIASLAHDSDGGPTVTFASIAGSTPTTPYSAGGYLQVLGESILQAGALFAPVGRIDLGSRTGASPRNINGLGTQSALIMTKSLVLGDGSITSVSGGNLTIPFGTTTDLTDINFQPTVSAPLSALPAAQISLLGDTITTSETATVDASGGGKLYAYEFVSGTGGSRDVLSRFNPDPYSGNAGYQFPDARQVYAILPADSPQLAALYDPIYSSDYGALYGTDVGKIVRLDAIAETAPGAGDGLTGGNYILLPAKYALLPGAMRLVENVGGALAPVGKASREIDGSINVGGTFGIAGTSIVDPLRRAFVVQSQAVFKRYSQIVSTDIAENIATNASEAGLAIPRLPNDAARIVIDPGSGLTIGKGFDTTARSDPFGKDGRGSQVDLLGQIINIVSSSDNFAATGVNIVAADLDKFNAASLLIGGTRTDKADGTTSIAVTAREIHVRNFGANADGAVAPIAFSAPELILATNGNNAFLDIADNAVISARGQLVDTRAGVYDLTTLVDGEVATTRGAFVRLANGSERLVTRLGAVEAEQGKDKTRLAIGAASFTGATLTVDSSFGMTIGAQTLALDKIAISSSSIDFSTQKPAKSGLVIAPGLESLLADIGQVTLITPAAVGFMPGIAADGTAASHSFKNLVIDAAGIRLLDGSGATNSAGPQSLVIAAGNISLRNSFADLGSCTDSGVTKCGATGSDLTINASGLLTFGGGTFRTYGFESRTTKGNARTAQVALAAAGGAIYTSRGSLELADAAFRFDTPFIVDRGSAKIPEQGAVQADYAINTSNVVSILASQPTGLAIPDGPLAPGARFTIGTKAIPVGVMDDGGDTSLSIQGTYIRATAGAITLNAEKSIAVGGNAILATPGYSQSFGKDGDPDQVRVSANAGAISLTSATGDLLLGADSTLAIGGASGGAGRLGLFASKGLVNLGSVIDAASPQAGASLALDSGKGAFDFAGFVDRFAGQFTGDVAIRTGQGDLLSGAGNAYKLASLYLVADGGRVTIDRAIDTSAVNGGNIDLFGRTGVTLTSAARLISRSTGYAETDTRQARAGNITLGTADGGALAVAAGAQLDLGVAFGDARLVAKNQIDPDSLVPIRSYTYVEGDIGGTLTLRAPVLEDANGQTVNVDFAGAVTGADSVSVIGFRRYDLADIAKQPGMTGVSVGGGTARLNPAAGGNNFLTDETSSASIPWFIQHFDISAVNARLGMLPGLGVAFHARPGVELAFDGDIKLVSNWNLAAGYVSDANLIAAASGPDPVLQVSALSTAKSAVYQVAPGREADLFSNYVHMLYRTDPNGNGINAGGEAAQFTFRAGGTLDVGASISDGFFNFADATDGDYLNYRLGGGALQVQPVFHIFCGSENCSQLGNYADLTGTAKAGNAINIRLNNPDRGELVSALAPFSNSANAASAKSIGVTGGGDPLGGASLFPILSNGRYAASSDIQLVGGAGDTLSVDPLHFDHGAAGDVVVEGETSYKLHSTARTQSFGGDALIRFSNFDLVEPVATAITSDEIIKQLGLDPATANGDALVRITFGTASKAANQALADLARDYVANSGGKATLINPKHPTGIVAGLDTAVDFLQSTGAFDLLAAALDGRSTSTPIYDGTSKFTRFKGSKDVTVRTLVRTGTGNIAMAAAGNVDLTNGNPVLLNKNGGKASTTANPALQLGGTAVYTAGHVVTPTQAMVRVVGEDRQLLVDPTAHLPAVDVSSPLWTPISTGGSGVQVRALQVNPVFATGGGSISVTAGRDVLGRRDVWKENFSITGSNVGAASQSWRVGAIGADPTDLLGSTYIRVNPGQFSSGIGALGGGNVRIAAGGNLEEMTIALDTTLASADIGDSFGAMVFGGGNLDVRVGENIGGGRFDVAHGTATITAGRDIGALGYLRGIADDGQDSTTIKNAKYFENLPEIRLTDARVNLVAGGSVSLASVRALGLNNSGNSAGFYSLTSGLSSQSGGTFQLTGGTVANSVRVLPTSLEVTSFGGDIDLGSPANFLYPGAMGQLSLLAKGTVLASAIDLDDGDASYLPGIYSAYRLPPVEDGSIQFGRGFFMPSVFPSTSDAQLRFMHNAQVTHLGDSAPARILVGGTLANLSLYTSKQTRISAGEDIVNLIFFGQNVASSDVTRIVAGRDITATTAVTQGTFFTSNRKVLEGNYIALGGPGSLIVEAGRNLGPFLNSATVEAYLFQIPLNVHLNEPTRSTGFDSYAGGILAVGNDFNPWLAPKSADIYAMFGVANGMSFDVLRETYLNPANVGALPGDLFEQTVDTFGNKSPDRSRPLYAPILIAWMKSNAGQALQDAYGTTDITIEQAYEAFAALPVLTQRRFLLDELYFRELAAPSDPNGPSYQQYVRGYRAVEALFPASLGYTSNDQSGQSNGGTRVRTGNLNLRLAAIETTRDSNITILGPGGDAILGSVVRTDAQTEGLAFQPAIFGSEFSPSTRPGPRSLNLQVQPSFPIGYEGALTLRGGSISSFTDGDLRLNQSRLFAQDSGTITLWSSNGDLNAGQGPKSASNIPPIILRFNPNAGSEVDSAGAVTGAGIAGFAGLRELNSTTGKYDLVNVEGDPDAPAALDLIRRLGDSFNGFRGLTNGQVIEFEGTSYTVSTFAGKATVAVTINGKTYLRDAPSIYLLAPAGTVDAGDAGVRASGDIFVAAAQVANADNFKVGGTAIGVPALASTAAPALPAGAASALVANLFQANSASAIAPVSRILVDVLGYFNTSTNECLDENGKPLPNCGN